MPIPVNQIRYLEVVIRGSAATGGSSVTPSINVFNFRRTAVSAPFSKAALNVAFQANILAPMLAAMNVRYTPDNVFIRILNDALDAPQGFAAAGVGAIATDSLPSDDAIYILFQSGLRGKSYRGNKHFGPASEIDTTNDILTGAGLARWQAVRDACALPFADANGNTWVNSIVSRTLSQLRVNPTNVIANDVTLALLDLNVGTMRKRRSKTIR